MLLGKNSEFPHQEAMTFRTPVGRSATMLQEIHASLVLS